MKRLVVRSKTTNLCVFENTIIPLKIFKVCKQNIFIFRSCRGTSFKKEYF